MTGITWLHLSDWHQKGRDFNRQVVRDELIKDIENRTEISSDLENIDFIVFSGDLAFSGKSEEYEAAKQNLFKPVLEATGLKAHRLFIVPGNHDLDHDALELLPQAILQPFTSNQQVYQWLSNEQKCNRLREPFAAYRQFVALYTGQANPDYANIRRFTIGGKRVALLGINSALMCARNYKEGKVDDKTFLTIGEHQITEYIRQMEYYDVRIAVLHHPFDWLTEFECSQTKNRIQDVCHFTLYGHQHCPDFQQQQIGNNRACVIIPAGASYDRRSTDNLKYANAYNFVHLDLDNEKGTIYLRRWLEDASIPRWDMDLVTAPKTGKIEFDLPRKQVHYPSQRSPVIPGELDAHFEEVIKAITQGLIVPFLGADINLCNRPKDEQQDPRPWDWEEDGDYPPTYSELAAYLNGLRYLQDFRCPLSSEGICPPECPINAALVGRMNLPHVSQYLSLKGGTRKLIEAIKEISQHPYKANDLHQFLANLRPLMDYKGWSDDIKGDAEDATRYPLIVTANFDTTLERAFIEAKQPFDLVSYSSINKSFIHQSDLKIVKEQGKDVIKAGNVGVITPTKAKEYPGELDLNKRPVILKLYCPIDWIDHSHVPFTITEDHFIDYLVCSKIEELIPGHLLKKLRTGYIWFLGYSLSRWNLRIVLNRLWPDTNPLSRAKNSWIQLNPESVNEKTGRIKKSNIQPVGLSDLSLNDYVTELEERLQEEPSRRERRRKTRDALR